MKSYNEESDAESFPDVRYPEKLHDFHNDLRILLERMKIGKDNNLVTNLRGKTEYVIHVKNLKQSLNHRFILKNIHRVIKFNQNAWLKPYINMNTKLREKSKNNFEKDFFKLKNNVIFRKTMENVRKYSKIKLVTTERRRNYLVSERNYHTTKLFTKTLLAMEIR